MNIQNKTENGLISIKSLHDVKTTADRLEQVLESKEMVIFARINHAAAARKVDKELRDTELIIFGNPKVGTALMQSSLSVAIDLPMKALISMDQNAQVWVSYNDPKYLAHRHGIKGFEEVLNNIEDSLNNFINEAIGN